MWCIGQITHEEYRARMYGLLALYARAFDPRQSVVCVDKKSLQLNGHSRAPLPMSPSVIAMHNYEYVRQGAANRFVAVEPKADHRVVLVTERLGKADFVEFVTSLLGGTYAKARRVHLVLDNLNTHFRKCFEDILEHRGADTLMRRVQFRHTPKHASWLNMAEMEIGILNRQCLDCRLADGQTLRREVEQWQRARNQTRQTIEWNFTRQDADRKLGCHYVPLFQC